MKFLCLHGLGMSALILEAELKKFTEALGRDHEFVFVDGFKPCGPAAGLTESAPPPYFCYYKTMSCGQVAEAHAELKHIMDDEGPFDACIGFSQGSAMIISLLMHHEVSNGTETPPFDFAVLFSPTIAISPDQKFGQEYIDSYAKYYDHDRDMTKSADKKIKAPKTTAALVLPGKKAQLVAEFQDLVAQGIQSAIENGDMEEEELKGEIKDADSFPRIFHPFMTKQRIRVPVLIVSGKTDPYKAQTEFGRKLCEKDMVRVIEHGGGHNIPRAPKDVKRVLEGIEWVMRQSTISSFQYI